MIELMICGLIVSHPWTVVLFIAALYGITDLFFKLSDK